jgi:predicted acyl esterase
VEPYFAARGYAALTVDIRGLVSSGGVNPFGFNTQEAHDGHVAVEWVAAKPWCDSNVGMWGASSCASWPWPWWARVRQLEPSRALAEVG